MAFVKMTPIFTEDEIDFLMRSGFSGQQDAFDYYAMQGDLRILPLMDKIVDSDTQLHSEKEHLLWTCQLLIDALKNKGDEESAKIVLAKRERIKNKLKLN